MKSLSNILKAGLQTLFPTCRQASRLQSDALDQPLSASQRFGLRLHLLLCRWCRRYGKHLCFLRHALHDHPEQLSESAPGTLSPEARERMKSSLRRESGR